ncbi:hypothetical protein WA158_004568 [Blastocystis sp. Blastoise]
MNIHLYIVIGLSVTLCVASIVGLFLNFGKLNDFSLDSMMYTSDEYKKVSLFYKDSFGEDWGYNMFSIESDDLMNTEAMLELFKFHDDLLALQVEDPETDEIIQYEDICLEVKEGVCFIQSPLQFWSYSNSTYLMDPQPRHTAYCQTDNLPCFDDNTIPIELPFIYGNDSVKTEDREMGRVPTAFTVYLTDMNKFPRESLIWNKALFQYDYSKYQYIHLTPFSMQNALDENIDHVFIIPFIPMAYIFITMITCVGIKFIIPVLSVLDLLPCLYVIPMIITFYNTIYDYICCIVQIIFILFITSFFVPDSFASTLSSLSIYTFISLLFLLFFYIPLLQLFIPESNSSIPAVIPEESQKEDKLTMLLPASPLSPTPISHNINNKPSLVKIALSFVSPILIAILCCTFIFMNISSEFPLKSLAPKGSSTEHFLDLMYKHMNIGIPVWWGLDIKDVPEDNIESLFSVLNNTISTDPLSLPGGLALSYMGDYIWLEKKCPALNQTGGHVIDRFYDFVSNEICQTSCESCTDEPLEDFDCPPSLATLGNCDNAILICAMALCNLQGIYSYELPLNSSKLPAISTPAKHVPSLRQSFSLPSSLLISSNHSTVSRLLMFTKPIRSDSHLTQMSEQLHVTEINNVPIFKHSMLAVLYSHLSEIPTIIYMLLGMIILITVLTSLARKCIYTYIKKQFELSFFEGITAVTCVCLVFTIPLYYSSYNYFSISYLLYNLPLLLFFSFNIYGSISIPLSTYIYISLYLICIFIIPNLFATSPLLNTFYSIPELLSLIYMVICGIYSKYIYRLFYVNGNQQ